MAGLFSNPLLSQCSSDDPSSPVGIVPVFVAGNPALCTGGVRIDPPASGTYNLGSSAQITITVTNGPCGQVFNWSVTGNVVVDQIVVKGGDAANLYDYTGQNPATTSDGNLHAPLNPNGDYAGLSHIDICFHYQLSVTKTAVTTYTRTYDWTVEKSCLGPDPLTLSPGQSYDYPFSVQINNTYTDSDWKVMGDITIFNNTPHDAVIEDVTDLITPGNIDGVPVCGITFPYVLPAGETLICTYEADLPNADTRLNTATVETSSPLVEGNTATADVIFGDPTTWVDECVTLWDECLPSDPPIVFCFDGGTYSYTCPVSYEECGTYEYFNEIYIRTNHSNTEDYANCSFIVEVPCDDEGGCTLTIGYWKTHSKYGPAPYDETWALVLPLGEDSPFFLSGQTWYEILWTPPAGNAYYILAKQYIAAYLNQLNGASIPANVLAAFNSATAIFNTYTPAQIAVLKGNNPLRKQIVNLGGLLDDYNNGITGPGHCSEEPVPTEDPKPTITTKFGDTGVNLHLTAGPNPFDTEVQFAFSVSYASQVTLQVFNTNGQLVATLFDTFLEAGEQRNATLDASGLTAGLHFYRLTTDREVTGGQLMLIK